MADQEILLTGRSDPPGAWRRLQAGPVTCFLDGIDLRRIRVGERELVSQIYVAVRDAGWNTFPPVATDIVVHEEDDGFLVTFRARHAHAGAAFAWKGAVVGLPDGSLSYEMDGVAEGDFDYNRIGINVLLRTDLLRGRTFRVGGAASAAGETQSSFVERIAPQAIVGGRLSGMTPPLRELEIDLAADAALRLEFEGDDFEAEDQRNFGDSTYKVYSTPVGRPSPMRATAGMAIRQSVGIAYSAALSLEAVADAAVAVRVGEAVGPLPDLGFGCASDGTRLSEREMGLLRQLRPAHLRLELVTGDPGWDPDIALASSQARALGCALEVELGLGDDLAGDLDRAASALRPAADLLAAVLIRAPSDAPFDSGPPARVVRAARARLGEALGASIPIGVASTFLATFNRSEIEPEDVGVVAFSVTPTLHRADDVTVTENLIALRDEVTQARLVGGGAPVHVGPVTLSARGGPWPGGPSGPDDLPPPVDPRQPSLLAAAWTVGAIAELSAAKPQAITCFETAGWRGVLERDAGSPMPERFHSLPGSVYPMWHVFADLAGWRDATVLAVEVSDPLRVAALAVRDAHGIGLLVACLDREGTDVSFGGLPAGAISARRLNVGTAPAAMFDPAGYRSGDEPVMRPADGSVRVSLGAYEVVRLNIRRVEP